MIDKLPEKWCIQRDSDNYKVINNYFNDGVKGKYYEASNELIHYPNYNTFVGFKVGEHLGISPKSGYIVISFEDFKRLVLKEPVVEVINNTYLTF